MITEVFIKTTGIPGVVEITANGWDGRILRMSREAFTRWKSKIEGKPLTPAVYILFANHFDKPQLGKQLYIGHTEDVVTRGTVHNAEKDYWSVILILTSRADWMNVAHTKNIECKLIEWVKEANRYEVQNGNDGGTTHLGQDDRTRLKTFLSGVRPVMQLANLDVFELNLDGIYTLKLIERDRTIAESWLKIETCAPVPTLRFRSGSTMRIFKIADEAQKLIDQGSASYDYGTRVLTFTSDAIFQPTNHLYWRVLGYPAHKWVGQCGGNLTTALDRITHA